MAYYAQGLYDCVIRDHGFNESKNKKTPYLWLQFVPVKDQAGNPVEVEYDRETQIYLTDKTIERAASQLRLLGYDGTSWSDLESHDFKQVNCKIRCLHEQGDEQVFEKWELPAPGGGAQSEKKKGMGKKLDALFGKALKDGKAAPKKEEPVAVADDDDDVPF